MARLESLRDRLPSLYRPDADEAVLPLVPLAPEDLVEVRTAAGEVEFFASARQEGTLIVSFDEPQRIVSLRLAAGRAPGSGYVLELYPFAEPKALSTKPAAVVGVADGFAPLRHPVEEKRFGLQLKRRSLLTTWLLGVADAFERSNGEASEVMQSHWFRFADRALYSPFFLRGRELLHPPLPLPKPADQPVLDFPYVLDLGRLGSILGLPPWQEPTGNSGIESVEEYRQRIGRIVALYTNGLGTVEALRLMTEAQLPVDFDLPPAERDRPFSIEEFAPLRPEALQVSMPGTPAELIGPLMHWPLVNVGVTPASPTILIQAPTEEEVAASKGDPADAPLVEVFDPVAERAAVGLAYRDTIPPGRTLRLQPAYASWLGTAGGILVARSEPGPAPADPTAPGPWTDAAGSPDGEVVALLQTDDRSLWAALNDDDGLQFWRLDSDGWTRVGDGPGEVFALAEDGTDLLIGTSVGLLRLGRFPDEDEPSAAQPEPEPGGRAVHALYRTADGTRWEGTSKGLGRLGANDSFDPFVLTGDLETEVHALAGDSTGALYVGTALGLFQFQPDSDRWYWYSGEEATDQKPEWEELKPTAPPAGRNFPIDDKVFLPAVTCIHRARDGALWIGTESGLARYVARTDRGVLAYRTMLEAFPDLVPGRVNAIHEDERGLLWFLTDRGLLRFDGRDFFQFRTEGGWVELGRADSLYDQAEPRPRGMWRFRRAGTEWQRFGDDLATPDWVPFSAPPRTTEEPAVHSLAFTDGVVADLLDAEGASSPVDPALLVTRYKLPGYERVVDGGLPAVPRLQPGESRWRYLSLEPAEAEIPPGPAWTIEGRFIPGEQPPEDAEPDPGRYDETAPDADAGAFGAAVYAFPPAARVHFEWTPRRPLSVLARLGLGPGGEVVDPAVLDRVWQGLQQVRPAGVEVALAVDGTIVRKETP